MNKEEQPKKSKMKRHLEEKQEMEITLKMLKDAEDKSKTMETYKWEFEHMKHGYNKPFKKKCHNALCRKLFIPRYIKQDYCPVCNQKQYKQILPVDKATVIQPVKAELY